MPEPNALLERAAENIARCVGVPASKTVALLYSPSTAVIACEVEAVLKRRNLAVRTVMAGDDSATQAVRQTLEQVEGSSGLVIMLDPGFAPTVFEVLGRPDRGIKRSSSHLFCDWFIGPASLMRTYGIDIEEQERFRRWILQAMNGARTIRVTTPSGTDMSIVQRHWNSSWGEVYTAPVEAVSNGTIVVDGSVYYEPTKQTFWLQIRDGRVINLHELNQSDSQQRMLWQDLTCDEQASVLAEFGLGINMGADPSSHLMEAEQARGTCHFGFGNNVPYGGRNVSRFHGDVCVLGPTIEVDGKVICRNGEFTGYVET